MHGFATPDSKNIMTDYYEILGTNKSIVFFVVISNPVNFTSGGYASVLSIDCTRHGNASVVID